jgi:hypothetical protein
MNIFAAISDGTVVAIVTSIATLLGLIVKSFFDLKCREEDRKDREQLAKFTEKQIGSLLEAGSEREKKIVKEIIQTRGVNIKALKEANGVNKKIESLGQKLVQSNEEQQ